MSPAHPAGGLAALRRLEEAEDFFAFFGLPFDPRVLRVYRLHVLKRFAIEMDAIDRARPALPEAERLGRYREALRLSHEAYARPTAPGERLFGIPRGEGLVTLGRKAR